MDILLPNRFVLREVPQSEFSPMTSSRDPERSRGKTPQAHMDARTLLVTPIHSEQIANDMKKELVNAGLDASKLELTHLHSVKALIIRGIPSKLADKYKEVLEAAFSKTSSGDEIHFEWDTQVSIASGDKSEG